MDYRYYYDNLEYGGAERRDPIRRRAREIVAGAAVASALAIAGHASGIGGGDALAVPCAVAALLSLILHRPVVRLMRSDGPILRAVGKN